MQQFLLPNSVGSTCFYNYDQASRLTSEVDNGVTSSYNYDAANQLIQAGAATYGYDATGNRTNTGYSTGPGNQLLGDGTFTYSYDNEGNQQSKRNGTDITTYSYDNQNHLTGMIETVGGMLTAQATFAYDVFGNRIETDEYTQSGGVTTITRNAYDGQNAWVDLDGSNTLKMRQVFLDGLNQILARVDSSGNLAWYGTDRLGSVHVVINAAGTLVLDQIVYDGYGNIISESNASSGDEYKYAGYHWDGVVEYYQAGRRWYDAAIGRWISQDPIQFTAGDPNLYRYVENDPTNATDPLGLKEYKYRVSKWITDEKVSWRILYGVIVSYHGSSPCRYPDSVTYVLTVNLKPTGPGLAKWLNKAFLPAWTKAISDAYNHWQLAGRIHVRRENPLERPLAKVPIIFQASFVMGGGGDQNVKVVDGFGHTNMTTWYLRDVPGGTTALIDPPYRDVIHEVGHMFGLKDEYWDANSYPNHVPPPDANNSIMFDSNGATSILIRHIVDIVNISQVKRRFSELQDMMVQPR